MSHRDEVFRPKADYYAGIIKDPKRWWWSKLWASIMLGTILAMWEKGPFQ